MNRKKIKLSASAISELKACPYRYYAKYILGIRKKEDSDTLRIGTNWHEIQDIIANKPGSVCVSCANLPANDPECLLCEGSGFLPENLMEAVMRVLDRAYTTLSSSMDPEKAEIERIILLYSLIGYNWYYSEDEVEVLARELEFEQRLTSPSGRTLPNVAIQGKIDKLIRYRGKLAIMEHKSTGKSVDSDSSFWAHLNLDTQTTLYIDAIQKMQVDGELVPYGVRHDEPLINTILYDVWHKPGIKPKMLTQNESKQFIEDGLYCGQKFEIGKGWRTIEDGNTRKLIGDYPAEFKPGAKEDTFAIRETPDMFGARLLKDIIDRTDFYFARKELSKTEDEMVRFRREVLSIYRDIRSKLKTDSFFHNEKQCEATFKCDYIAQCYNGVELNPENPPEGFYCIFDKEKK
ncbi:MAG: PD-(D/E)XK nuclease family protein [Deltaproteobacteria bacterium]|nr:PD-(D/E)XK nuclease family protein [Deltaproteobacteria bacterium]